MPSIADLSEHGTDTKRVEKLRELLLIFYKDRDQILENSRDGLLSAESYATLMRTVRRIFINRVSTVLSEDWTPEK